MTDQNPENQDEPRKREPYEPPAIESEVAFETMALSCSGGTPSQCPGPTLGS